MIQKLHLYLLRSAAAALFASVNLAAQVGEWDVRVKSPQFTLYTDPYNGNVIKVGGFSGIYPAVSKKNSFYVITDRGPAPDFVDGSTTYKTFAVPDFGPHLLTVRLLPNGMAKIDDIMPLRKPGGAIISGLPGSLPPTDVPFDFNLNILPFDEDSIDAEGVTVDPWGNFWVSEEYKPSVAMIDSHGVVRMRLVPEGTLTGVEAVPTFDLLPGILAKRRNNRGLEGIAASGEGILYAVMQRPLNNPNRASADANGNIRLLAIDLRVLLQSSPGLLLRQYLYRVPSASATLSDLFSTGPTTLLVPERGTDKLYEIDVANATDITPLENAAGGLISDPTKSLEQLDTAGLQNAGILPVAKTVIIDSLTAIDPLLEKVEGVCIADGRIVLTHDNDFNVAETASKPANPLPGGPVVQLELLGNNYPKIFTVPLP